MWRWSRAGVQSGALEACLCRCAPGDFEVEDPPVREKGAGSNGASDNQPQEPTQPGFYLFNVETRLLDGLLRATV